MNEPWTADIAAAHIITKDAEALGDPQILILTRDEGMGARVVETHDYNGSNDWPEIQLVCLAAGWQWGGAVATTVEPGYYVIDVERI